VESSWRLSLRRSTFMVLIAVTSVVIQIVWPFGQLSWVLLYTEQVVFVFCLSLAQVYVPPLRVPNSYVGQLLVISCFFAPLVIMWMLAWEWTPNKGFCSSGEDVFCRAHENNELPLEIYADVFFGSLLCNTFTQLSWILIGVLQGLLWIMFAATIGCGAGTSGVWLFFSCTLIYLFISRERELIDRQDFINRKALIAQANLIAKYVEALKHQGPSTVDCSNGDAGMGAGGGASADDEISTGFLEHLFPELCPGGYACTGAISVEDFSVAGMSDLYDDTPGVGVTWEGIAQIPARRARGPDTPKSVIVFGMDSALQPAQPSGAVEEKYAPSAPRPLWGGSAPPVEDTHAAEDSAEHAASQPADASLLCRRMLDLSHDVMLLTNAHTGAIVSANSQLSRLLIALGDGLILQGQTMLQQHLFEHSKGLDAFTVNVLEFTMEIPKHEMSDEPIALAIRCIRAHGALLLWAILDVSLFTKNHRVSHSPQYGGANPEAAHDVATPPAKAKEQFQFTVFDPTEDPTLFSHQPNVHEFNSSSSSSSLGKRAKMYE